MSPTEGHDVQLLTVEIDGRSPCVVTLKGELDVSTVAALEERLADVVSAHPERLVFDLSELSFVDSSGIGLFLRTAREVGQVVIRQPSDIVRQVMDHMGLAEILVLEP